jgi:type IV pilus assembly protein PilX
MNIVMNMKPIRARVQTRPRGLGGASATQGGAVLFISLIFLLILTLLGVMLARMQSSEERMAQNDSNHELAVEAAEAALRFAESNIATGIYTPTMMAANAGGYYTLNPAVGSSVVWNGGTAITYNGAADNAVAYTGNALNSVAQPPAFIIENLPSVAIGGTNLNVGGGYNQNGSVTVYQITTHATGGDQTGSATLRSIYEQE